MSLVMELTSLICLATSVSASAVGLTSWYLRTLTVLSACEAPLRRRSAPTVVLVVATRTPEAWSNGLNSAMSVKMGMGVCAAALCK